MFREFSHEDRVIFELKAEDYNYDHIIQAINYICPDEYSEVEITSYYECLNFTKDQIEVNFSYVLEVQSYINLNCFHMALIQ